MSSKKNFLITGGAGFIGSHLASRIIELGNDAIIIDDLSSGFSKNLEGNTTKKLITKKVQEVAFEEIETVDGIFHLAAQASVPLSINAFYESSENNMLSTFKVFDWARKIKVPIVYASSSAIYGNLPLGDDEKKIYNILSPYAQDKLCMEYYAKMMQTIYNVNSFGLRFFNVYGPKQDPNNPYSGVISIFIDRLIKGKPINVNGGYQTRDFIFIDDIVSSLIKSMFMLSKNKLTDTFNVGTGKSITVNLLVKTISDILKVNPNIIMKDLPNGDPEISSGTFKKIKNILGVNINNFKNIESGLIETIKYFKEEN